MDGKRQHTTWTLTSNNIAAETAARDKPRRWQAGLGENRVRSLCKRQPRLEQVPEGLEPEFRQIFEDT
jgi:hypothetical protein